MATFEIASINLSMKDAGGDPLTANVYKLEGVQNADGSLREMSIGQLVMALCLSRATEVEARIVAKMEALAANSADLEKLTALDKDLVEWLAANENNKGAFWTKFDAYKDALALAGYPTLFSYVLHYTQVEALVSDVEAKMDSLNSVSQTTLIDIQSLTATRDDTYNLVSNVLKSLQTVLIGNVNNL